MPQDFVVKIAVDGVAEPTIIELTGADQPAAEAFVATLREDTESARNVGVPLITTAMEGRPDISITLDPRTIATIDLEIAEGE
jgi:hypothetical protein